MSVVIVCTFYFTYSIQHIDIYVDSIVNELLYACVCIYINTRSFHWILMVFDLPKNHLIIYDSMRKLQKDYQDMIDIIQG